MQWTKTEVYMRKMETTEQKDHRKNLIGSFIQVSSLYNSNTPIYIEVSSINIEVSFIYIHMSSIYIQISPTYIQMSHIYIQI